MGNSQSLHQTRNRLTSRYNKELFTEKELLNPSGIKGVKRRSDSKHSYRIVIQPKKSEYPYLSGWIHVPESKSWFKVITKSERVHIQFQEPDSHVYECFKQIADLNSINQITLIDNKMEPGGILPAYYWDDDDLKLLSNMKINSLHLSNSFKVTNSGLKLLSKISGLNYISLSNVSYTSELLTYLANCEELNKIHLINLDLKSQNFEVLKDLNSLEHIMVNSSCKNVDKESISNLKKLRPDIKIEM